MARNTSPNSKGKTKKKKKKKSPPKVSYHKKPGELDLRAWQIALRQQYGQTQEFKIENVGNHPVYSEFTVFNPDFSSIYKVAIRAEKPGLNFCSCPDFKSNELGTCKHIEAVLFKIKKTRGARKHFKEPYRPGYTSVYLQYGEDREVKIRIGSNNEDAFRALAKKYFNAAGKLTAGGFEKFEKFLEAARSLDADFRCYPDALEFILQQRENISRQKRIEALETDDKAYFSSLLKAKLFPYQKQGILFAAKAGRCLIADEMGLGKTIQAIGGAELLKREAGISKVLVVCPTSLKYQWKSEIEKFTGNDATVIEGMQTKRRRAYQETESFFQIVTYNVVSNDIDFLLAADYDLVILDEAQRIKNWNTKISRAVKRLHTTYAFVLTGTPLENKLEELYSIAQFVDNYRLGPLYLFQHRHQIREEETGRIVGYRDLNKVKERLSDVLIRRTKKEVLKQLPKRMDKNLFVPMTEAQEGIHKELGDMVAQLVAKWRRLGFLKEKDRQRLLIFLSQMRMVCDSTYILDQRTRHDTKIDELMCILEEALIDDEVKVVVFSQWERMTRLVAEELEDRSISFRHLHGGVPSEERGQILREFNEDPNCRVFLSTDAGGLGLNLQSASLVINLDIPWNPAVLEQRIGRIYRLGQRRPVSVINLIATGTIEHQMLHTLKFKAGMAAGVLDDGDDSIFLGTERFKELMETVEKVTQGVPEVQPPLEVTADSDIESPITGESMDPSETGEPFVEEETIEAPGPEIQKESKRRPGSIGGTAIGSPEELIQQGAGFFQSLVQTLADEKATRNLVNTLVQKDKETGQTYLKLPVENAETVHNALALFGNLLRGFTQGGG